MKMKHKPTGQIVTIVEWIGEYAAWVKTANGLTMLVFAGQLEVIQDAKKN